MRKFKRFMLIFLLIVGLFLGWIAYSISPYPVENQFPPAQELVSIYRKIYLKQFSCVWIYADSESEKLDILFYLKTYPERTFSLMNYSADECLGDIIQIKNATVAFMKEHPENEINRKKITFSFCTLLDEVMYMYNFNFDNGQKETDATNFCYYNLLRVGDLGKLADFSDAKILTFSMDIRGTK